VGLVLIRPVIFPFVALHPGPSRSPASVYDLSRGAGHPSPPALLLFDLPPGDQGPGVCALL